MKKMKYKFLIPTGLVVVVILAACSKDFLNKPPLGTLNPEIVATENGVQGLLIGAYSLVDGIGIPGDGFASGASNWTYGGVASDDAYKGSDPTDVAEVAPFEVWTSLTPTNSAIPQKWKVCYAGIQRSNDVINKLAIAPGISTETQTLITAQARFLRGFYHLELKRVFNNIPFVDETISPSNLAVTNTVDAWPKIEEDLNFAKDNLPDSWGAEPGRANKWAAQAVLARAYMTQRKYTDAQTLLLDLITNGKTAKGDKYALFPHFYSNFNPEQKNGPESVFAAQTSVHDGSSVDWASDGDTDGNGNRGDILNFPYNGGPGACCGFYNPSQDLANAFKTDANGLPLLAEDNTGYSGGLKVSYPTTPYTGTLDPRIDWTIGRKPIPYLDWGNHPGDDWIRNPVNDGHFSPKKNVYAKSQIAKYTDVGTDFWGPTELVANNVNIIRFADLLLMYAECLVEADDIPGAMTYVNLVRARAADPTGWVYKNSAYDAASATYTTQTTPADNYKIALYTAATFTAANAMTAVRFERRLELAMEGHRFFDLQRYDKDTKYPLSMATVINRYIAREKGDRPLKLNAQFTANKNEYFPIPLDELENLNSDGTERIKQNPGY
jgi:hypothetical protein